MNYLVTGGAGFIGSNIVDLLINKGERVRVLDNLSTGKKENLAGVLDKIDLVVGDIRDSSILESAVSGIDYILHQAALPSVPRSLKEPKEALSVNGGGTLELLIKAKAAKVKCFVYASSSSLYGLKSPYAVSKGLGEQYCILFNRLYGLKTVCLRYFNVFGPRQDPNSQYAAVVPKFIKILRNNEQATIYGDGQQTRDFTYVKNVVEANLDAATNGNTGVCDIGCGKETTVNELFGLLKQFINTNGKFQYAPPRPGDIKHSCANITKAAKELNYNPRIDLKEGLRLTANE